MISYKIWLLVTVSIQVSVSGGITWMTQSHADWELECPKGQIIQSMVNTYTIEERLWNISCDFPRSDVNFSKCEWGPYVNEVRSLFQFQCPRDGVIAGIGSFYNSDTDRNFKFFCCYPEEHVTHACQFTPFINELKSLMSYRVPDNWILRGAVKRIGYIGIYRDQRWSFYICKLDKVVSPSC